MNFTPEIFLLAGAFFLIAALYASVGFGGGSSYLALLAIFLPDFFMIKTTALLCNLVVVSSGTYLCYRQGLLDFRKFLPLAVCSVPAAFIGATFHLSERTFYVCLGGVLTVSGVLLMSRHVTGKFSKASKISESPLFNFGLGASSGFLSGLVGIGGGILISPVLHLIRWDSARKIAALAGFFILVNSVAGLVGQFAAKTFHTDAKLLLLLLPAVFCGGQLGTRISLQKIKPEVIKVLTGVLVFYIGINLIWKYTF